MGNDALLFSIRRFGCRIRDEFGIPNLSLPPWGACAAAIISSAFGVDSPTIAITPSHFTIRVMAPAPSPLSRRAFHHFETSRLQECATA
jgi:hypothetical protein